MFSVDEIENMSLVRDLIGAGLRISLVASLTKVHPRTLRSWWKEIHGKPPSNGKLPETVLSFIKNQDDAATVSAYAALHHRFYGCTLSAGSLLTSWREFRRLCAPLDINAAYYAVRDIKVGSVTLMSCCQCKASFIYDSTKKATSRCPFCETKAIEK